ncbi:MAG: alanine racemase [Clostridia bacterium]|nr:alanine racemase [Clostridia bacterium]
MRSKYTSLEYHRSFVRVDLSAIRKNFDALKGIIRPETKTMAIVKANAYGHGSVRVAKELEGSADYFAVAALEEAMELRENGIKTPILILAYTSPSQYEELINNNIATTIYSLDDAKLLSQTAEKLGKKAVIHVGVDTGMGRIGFSDTEESVGIIEIISKLPFIEIEGIFTHFACADVSDKASALSQKKRFDSFLSILESRNIIIPIKHASNSAAIIDLDCNYDMVRMGISLYGLYPSDEVMAEKVSLTPAMEVVSHVIHIKDVEPGVGISYGHTYVTAEKRRIATVCIGYADGFNRAFSNKGYVLINGKKAPITGRVCMDQIMVDVTDIDDVRVGDDAIIMGESHGATITAEELGAMCGSFNYEVICTFMPRVTRVFYKDGERV